MKISVLLAVRKNSKFMAKFLAGYIARTNDFNNTELLVICNAEDTWNTELIDLFRDYENITFYSENKKLGRGGLHIYYNDLLKYATGDWIIYFCEDHFITLNGWDDYLRSVILERELNPDMVYSIIPKFDNVGAMNQVISRGYLKAIGGYLGRHGQIDSYLNDVNARLPQERIIKPDKDMFHDFTHDIPRMMDDIHTKTGLCDEALKFPNYTQEIVRTWIEDDANKIKLQIEGGK